MNHPSRLGETGSPSLTIDAPSAAEARLAPSVAAEGRSDLNALLAAEQTSIMRAEAEGDGVSRLSHEGDAEAYRLLIGRTSYPARPPHDFDARRAALSDAPAPDDRESLEGNLRRLEQALASSFSAGLIGTRFNTFAHRSRAIGLEKGKLGRLAVEETPFRPRPPLQRREGPEIPRFYAVEGKA